MPNERHDRRGFAKAVAAGGAAALLRTGTTTADEPPAADDAARDEPEALPPQVLLTLALLARYPHEKLDDDVLPKIEQEINVGLYRGRRLAAFPLTNGDEPAFVFSAFRADG